MPRDKVSAEQGFRALGRTLARDRAWWWFVSVFVLIHLPFLVPTHRLEPLETYSDSYLMLLLLPFVLLAARHRLSELGGAERPFWSYVTFVILCWWIVRILYVVIPANQRLTGVHLVIDGFYLLFYVGLLLAAETRPDLRSGYDRGPTKTLESLGLGILLVALLVYFILIPWNLDPESYASWEPSLYLYIVLDLILAVRFAQLAWISRSSRWSHLYRLFGATAALWTVFGILELRWWTGTAGWLDAPLAQILWQLPTVTLVAAIRLRHHPFPEDPDARSAGVGLRRSRLLRTASPLIAAVLSLPVIHLGLSTFGLVADDTRHQREIVVFVGLLALGALTLAEQAMAQSESLRQNTILASLIDSAPLPIVLLDSEHRALTCNPAFEALFLLSRAQILGQNLDELITTEDTLPQARSITDRVGKGETTFTVARRSRSDGSQVDVRIFGIPLTSKRRLIGIFAIYQDLSERLRSERVLKESEDRFRRLSEAAFEGIILSVDGTIVDANEQAAAIFGFPVTEMIGSDMGRRVVPEQKELVRARSRSGYELPYEIECFRRDRSTLTLEVRGRSIPYKGRDARVTVVRDVTEHRRLEDQLRQSQKMEAVGRLAAGIAHDFNNLLQIILGRGDLLGQRTEPGGESRRWAGEITEAAERAAVMTRQLLAFARQQPLRPEVLDLNEIVAGAESMVAPLLGKDVSLTLKLASSLGKVKADPSQIERVVLNLAINARDAMPDGGELTFETANTRVDGSSGHGLADVRPGAYVCLTVSDTGTGMETDTLARAFEPFFTTKQKGVGAGLGLATVHGIVKQSGGGVSVETAIGEGTTFRVFLPRMPEEGEA